MLGADKLQLLPLPPPELEDPPELWGLLPIADCTVPTTAPATVATAIVAVSSAAPAFPPIVDALSFTVFITLRASCGARFMARRAPAATDLTFFVTAALRAAIDRLDDDVDDLARPDADFPPEAFLPADLARDALPDAFPPVDFPLFARPAEPFADDPRLPLRPDEPLDPLFAI